MERKIWSPPADSQARRRKEWVTLPDGELCVWGFTMAETMRLMEHSVRPAIDPRGGIDKGESMLWQIILSCYDSEAPGARPIFGPENLDVVLGLGMEEQVAIQQAIQRVNGGSAAEVKLLEDFTPPKAASPSAS